MNQPAAFVRSRDDRWIAGVLGGIAQRYGWSSFVVRVVFLALSIFSAGFPGLLIYIILWIVMPFEKKP